MPTCSVTIPLRNYKTGERVAETTLPAWATQIAVELRRCTAATPLVWPDPLTFVAIDLEDSLDGGAMWTPAGGWGAYGGIHVRRDGSQAVISRAAWPCRGGALLRATVTITNGPCRTSGQLTVSG